MLRNTDESLARVLTRRAAQLTLVGALAATPLAMAAGTASATDWDAVANCESSGNWHTDTGNGFKGGLQFTSSTWKAYGGKGSPEDASREQQIQVAEKVKDGQGMKAWPVCGKKG
jgi:resuscitation-promoting factor RpfA